MNTDPLPVEARDELERLGVRWQQLPLARALVVLPDVRALAQRFADVAADLSGRPRAALPDLGPATALDQLVVTAYDLAGFAGQTPDAALDVTAELRALRTRVAGA